MERRTVDLGWIGFCSGRCHRASLTLRVRSRRALRGPFVWPTPILYSSYEVEARGASRPVEASLAHTSFLLAYVSFVSDGFGFSVPLVDVAYRGRWLDGWRWLQRFARPLSVVCLALSVAVWLFATLCGNDTSASCSGPAGGVSWWRAG